MTRTTGGLRALMCAGAVLAAGAAVAAGLTGAEAQQDRAAHMKALGKASKAIREQLKTGAPDPAVIRQEAAAIHEGSEALPTWFPAGSGTEANPQSRALPAVWTDPQTFAAKAHDFAVAAASFDAAAASGDMTRVAPAFEAVGASCKGCHEKFQAPEKN